MSPFERLFQTAEQIQAEAREQEQDLQGGPTRPEGDPPTFRCRVCALESAERGYCPDCLADTMVPVARTRAAADPAGD